MRLKISIAVALAALLTTTNTYSQIKETPLLRIGDTTSSLQEFDFIYKKNNQTAQLPVSKQEYLDLFVNYKLKVAEAKAMGLDTLKQYKEECEYYSNELTGQYLIDTTAVAEYRKRIVARMGEEVDASHILVRLSPNSTPDDTLKAYLRISDARKRVVGGENFEKVAKQCSDDPSVVRNGGNIGYFSALQMVAPFEDLAYSTAVGEISEVFRTQFGYHFLKVNNRRPFGGEIKVSHIMKMISQVATPEEERIAKAKIDSLYNLLKGGADFATLARDNSDDRQSAQNNGEMPWFSESRIIPEFGKVAFALKANDEYSEPFRTPFGWHIAKRLNFRNQKPTEDINQMIDNASMSGHPIAKEGTRAKAKALLKEYSFKWDEAACKEVEKILSANESDSTKLAKLNCTNLVLATFATAKVMADDIKISEWNVSEPANENLQKIAERIILDYEKKQLSSKNAEYKYIMQEYYDGLLVFEICQRTIWSKNDTDSATLAGIYNNNIARYSTGGTFEGDIFFFKDKKTAAEAAKHTKASRDKIAKKAFRTISGTQNQGGLYDDYIWSNIKSDYVLTVGKITNGEPIPFESAQGLIIADHQQIIEQQWIAELHKKFNPKILTKVK